MSSYFGINSDYSSSFFSSFLGGTSSSSTTTSSSSTSSTSSLTDYAMIKNGTYRKLMEKYYESDTSDSQTDIASETKALSITKSDSLALGKSAGNLNSSEFVESNRDDILDKITKFVDNYNELVGSADDVDTKSILQKTVWMTDTTSKNSDLLSSVGISVGSDNTLTIDKDTLKKANMSTLESIFSGSSSFVDKVSQKATQIYNLAKNQISMNNSSSGYTNTGDYTSITSSSKIDSLL